MALIFLEFQLKFFWDLWAPRLGQTGYLQVTLKISKVGKIVIGGFEICVTWWYDIEECWDQILLIYVNNYGSSNFLIKIAVYSDRTEIGS